MSEPEVKTLVAWGKANGATVPGSPATWFAARFPGLRERFGKAIQEVYPDDDEGRPYVKDVAEDFLAATLGDAAMPEAPTVFVAVECRFYTYSPEDGIFHEAREPILLARLSELLLECARACEEKFDTSNLEFRFRDTANLKGVVARARGLLEVSLGYFETDLREFVPCQNGMLRLADMTLLPFSPSYRRQTKLAVAYEPGAKCPLFLEKLMRPALDPDDVELLQRWCGLDLIGINLAQRFVLLTGTAGGGKGTFIRVLLGIIGATNVGMLRANLLRDRFELGRLWGKTLLYGADVPENFLNCQGASVLKALTGGDPVTLEFKGSNETPDQTCRFNAVATSNSRLKVRLEGDTDAWRRRLIMIAYQNPKPEEVIVELSERILAEEGPGVLNWMLEGLEKLRADGWQLHLTPTQQKRVDDLLLESEADVVFAKESLRKDGTASLTVVQCYAAYVTFCGARGWAPMPKKDFSNSISETVTRLFALTVRNDILDENGKAQRGWKGIACA